MPYCVAHGCNDDIHNAPCEVSFQRLPLKKPALLKQVIINSCNMGTSVLPDMYTRSPRAAGPRDEGVHIRQNTSAHVATIMYHFKL